MAEAKPKVYDAPLPKTKDKKLRTVVGVPAEMKGGAGRAKRHKSVAALINRLRTAQETLAAMDDSSELARAAVKAEIQSIEAQLEASKAWHDKQAADAKTFREQIRKDRVREMGLSGLVDPSKVDLP